MGLFLHFFTIPGQGYRTLPAGTEVEFELVQGPQGHPYAFNVSAVRLGRSWGEGSLTSGIVSGLNQ